MSDWHLYLIRTESGALYTGISTDVDKRFKQHRSGRGSKYLRAQLATELVYQCNLGDRSLTSKAEHRVKKLNKSIKENIVRTSPSRKQLLEILDLPDSTG